MYLQGFLRRLAQSTTGDQGFEKAFDAIVDSVIKSIIQSGVWELSRV